MEEAAYSLGLIKAELIPVMKRDLQGLREDYPDTKILLHRVGGYAYGQLPCQEIQFGENKIVKKPIMHTYLCFFPL